MKVNFSLHIEEIERVIQARPDLRTLDRTSIIRFALDQLVIGSDKLDQILAIVSQGTVTPLTPEVPVYRKHSTPVTRQQQTITPTITTNEEFKKPDAELEYEDPLSDF